MTPEDMNYVGFHIYSTSEAGGKGLVQVSDPLHLQILKGLGNRPMSTTEISGLTGKAQSTLSVHLDQMVNEKLISSEYDPNDSRRKIYSLLATLVASSQEPSPAGLELSKSVFREMAGARGDYHEHMVRAFSVAVAASGLDIAPMMELMGYSVGEYMAEEINSNKIEDIIRHVQDFYEINNIGEVCIYTFLPLTIIIKDNAKSPGFVVPSNSYFCQGLFRAVLSKLMGKKYEVTRSETFGTENDYYKFVIELAP